MKLKCQLAGAKCPPYSHEGEFQPDNATITGLLPDLRRCASCIAYGSPSLPAFQDDLIQIASITLIKKGPAFNPLHESGASFGTFIRPRICVSLMNAKCKEVKHHVRECSECYIRSDFDETLNQNGNYERDIDLILNAPDANTECFVDRLIWEISVANFKKVLPQLIEALTHREQQVFACIREDMSNCDIAKLLKLSPPRISQLVRNVEQKLRKECQTLGLIE
ncbi:MAG: sigma-70 family RNA polymerase sigma factor [Candidatus Poribacteria bacterium]|nr:sigma-70 family RNA polymerase sigma factor [Candidatus Poribacteria bacterium]